MKDKLKLQKLKDNYDEIIIPDELSKIVEDARSKNKSKRVFKNVLAIAASVSIVIIGGINFSPTFADSLEDIPVIGDLVKVVNLANYNMNRNGFDIAIDVPKVEGLSDKKLEDKINRELQKDARDLYNKYVKELTELEKNNIEGRQLVQSWYEILTDNENVFSMVVYSHSAQGSSNTTRKFYNIDKKNNRAITLSKLFKSKDYIEIISTNIKEQMLQQMKSNPNKVYWINSEIEDMDFKGIKEDQGFYINDNNELVICFDKYEVAPGAMGLVEFVIPTTLLESLE